jgi:hypothetical protein
MSRYMMERYGGVRVYWDGNALYYKNKPVYTPKNLNFPTTPFEGEVW